MRLLREPLLHFLLAGALLFGAYAWLNRGEKDSGAADTTIRVTEREIAWLTESWSRQSRRPPSEGELRGMLADYLREELLAREAKGLELDRDDTVVRRRLAQKMNFVLEDTARLAPPTEEEIRARYDADPARFKTPSLLSFVAVYFNVDKHGDRAKADAQEALIALNAGGANVDLADFGDASLLPAELRNADERAIADNFGQDFARAVMRLEPGAWQGPFESAFGFHLVRITERRQTEPQQYEAVRDSLADELRREREEAAKRAYFTGLLKRYQIDATESARPLTESALATLRGDQK